MYHVQRLRFVITDEDGHDNLVQHQVELVVQLEPYDSGNIQATADVPGEYFKDGIPRTLRAWGLSASIASTRLIGNLFASHAYLPHRDKAEAERSG